MADEETHQKLMQVIEQATNAVRGVKATDLKEFCATR